MSSSSIPASQYLSLNFITALLCLCLLRILNPEHRLRARPKCLDSSNLRLCRGCDRCRFWLARHYKPNSQEETHDSHIGLCRSSRIGCCDCMSEDVRCRHCNTANEDVYRLHSSAALLSVTTKRLSCSRHQVLLVVW